MELPNPSDSREITPKRKLAIASTTNWWPTSTIVDLLDHIKISSHTRSQLLQQQKLFQ